VSNQNALNSENKGRTQMSPEERAGMENCWIISNREPRVVQSHSVAIWYMTGAVLVRGGRRMIKIYFRYNTKWRTVSILKTAIFLTLSRAFR